MSIAALATPGAMATLQAFFHWLVTDAIPLVRPSNPASLQALRAPLCGDSPGKSAKVGLNGCNQIQIANRRRAIRPVVRQWDKCDSVSTQPSRRPITKVRMVRLVEAGQAPTSVGRMVISGRMADVCAELDRLAASEAVRR